MLEFRLCTRCSRSPVARLEHRMLPSIHLVAYIFSRTLVVRHYCLSVVERWIVDGVGVSGGHNVRLFRWKHSSVWTRVQDGPGTFDDLE